MRVVLREGVPGLGTRGDVVDVADGYARNALIPQQKAEMANAGAEIQAGAMKKAWEISNAADREAAEELAKRLVSTPLEIAARSGESGKLFGSVSSTEIVEAISIQQDVEIDRKMVMLDEPIRTLGSHMVVLKPHTDVEFPITVSVVEA